MPTPFELSVLRDLAVIKAGIATVTQSNADQARRIEALETFNKSQDTRHWIKSLVVGAGIIIGHPLARKLGLDI